MLENPHLLREIVKATGAQQTNEESPEDVEHLCGKCDDYAASWQPVADKIWAQQDHKKPSYENYAEEKIKNPALAGFDHADGSHAVFLD